MTSRWKLEEDLKYETAELENATADIPTHRIHRMQFFRSETLFDLQRYREAAESYRLIVGYYEAKVFSSELFEVQVSLYKLGVCECMLAPTNLALKGKEYFWRSILVADQISKRTDPSYGGRMRCLVGTALDPLLQLANMYQDHLNSDFLAKLCLELLVWFEKYTYDWLDFVDAKKCHEEANQKLKQLDWSECMDHSTQLLMEMYLSDQEWENQVCDRLLSRFPEANQVYATFKVHRLVYLQHYSVPVLAVCENIILPYLLR